MATKTRTHVVAAFIIHFLCFGAYGAWTEPVHLSELNEPGFVTERPSVSSDGSVIYFVRWNRGISYYLWEAQLNEETGLYEQQRVVSEIGRIGGQNIFGVWLSTDSKRMYHCWSDDDIIGLPGWERAISMAERNSSDVPWRQVKNHFELQQGHNYLSYVSLTSDELNIMWLSGSNDIRKRVFTASRSSVNDRFSNIVPVTELDGLGDCYPFMSANGLSVYYTQKDDDGYLKIWKGSRESLDSTFGDFTPLSEVINTPGVHNTSACITPDGKSIYFYRVDPSKGPGQAGIYVSHWFDTPRQAAIKNTRKAIKVKESAVKAITAAIECETVSLESINYMLENNAYEGLNMNALIKAQQQIRLGITKQTNAQRELQKSLSALKESLALLVGEKKFVRAKPQGQTSNKTRRRKEITINRHYR